MAERSLVLIDVDKTAYNDYLIFSIINQEAEDGLIEKTSLQPINEALDKYRQGEIGYEEMVETVVSGWANALADCYVSDVLNHTTDFLNANRQNFHPYVSKVIQMVADTHCVYFVTAEPQFVARPIAQMFGAVSVIASEFEVEDGRFTGKATKILSGREHKLEAITHLFEIHTKSGSIAFGDSEGDIEMLSAVENPICINPNEGLEKVRTEEGWLSSSGFQDTIDQVTELLKKKN